MSAVSETGTMRVQEYKSGSELNSSYSYFQNDDVLVAKITPCYENNKIAVIHIEPKHGFGSTEFHVIRPLSWTHAILHISCGKTRLERWAENV
jgi:type I restriction enzyme S subunit